MSKKSLPAVSDWIRESLNIYFKKENFIYLSKYALLQLLVAGVTYFATMLFVLPYYKPETMEFDISSISTEFWIGLVVFAIVSIFVNVWLTIATIKGISQVVDGGRKTVRENLMSSVRKILPFIAYSILAGILVLLGGLLLVIPGIILLVWFYFAQFELVAGGRSPVAALKASRNLARDYFWQILGRALVVVVYSWVVTMLLSMVLMPLIQLAVVTLIGPYFSLVPYLMYRDLKNIKG